MQEYFNHFQTFCRKQKSIFSRICEDLAGEHDVGNVDPEGGTVQPHHLMRGTTQDEPPECSLGGVERIRGHRALRLFPVMAQAQPRPTRAGVVAVHQRPHGILSVEISRLLSSMVAASKSLPQCHIHPQVRRPPHLLPLWVVIWPGLATSLLQLLFPSSTEITLNQTNPDLICGPDRTCGSDMSLDFILSLELNPSPELELILSLQWNLSLSMTTTQRWYQLQHSI